jgi:phosphatidate cytidylyltransferase
MTALSKSSALTRRIAGGILVAIPTALAVAMGDLVFTVFVAIVLGIGAAELNALLRAIGYQASIWVTVLTALTTFAGVRFPEIPLLQPILSIALMGSFALQLRHANTREHDVGDWAVAFAGGLYLGWTCGHLAELLVLKNGIWWLMLAVGCTWATDSGAYLVGRMLGRHKLAPMISPNKTWEGYFGGMLCGALVGAAIGAFSPLPLPAGAIVGALIGGLSVFGDLIESMIKRQANAKDSGHLIPGHGGVLDRIDSLLWSGVIVFYVAQYVRG